MVRNIDRTRTSRATILLAARNRLGRLAADEVDDIVRNQRAIARARGVFVVGSLRRRVPCRAAKKGRRLGGKYGEGVGGYALGLEGPVNGEALPAAA